MKEEEHGGGMMPSSAEHLPSSPFQRRFVPPTANTGYMNLNDDDYSYTYGQQEYYPTQQQQYMDNQPMYYQESPSSTLVGAAPANQHQFKPDQIEQKPNAA